MPGVGGSSLAAVKGSAEHTGLVDTHFGFFSEAGVVPYSLGQLSSDCCCFDGSAVDLCIDGK